MSVIWFHYLDPAVRYIKNFRSKIPNFLTRREAFTIQKQNEFYFSSETDKTSPLRWLLVITRSESLVRQFDFSLEFSLDIGLQNRAKSSMGCQTIRLFTRIFAQSLPNAKAPQIQQKNQWLKMAAKKDKPAAILMLCYGILLRMLPLDPFDKLTKRFIFIRQHLFHSIFPIRPNFTRSFTRQGGQTRRVFTRLLVEWKIDHKFQTFARGLGFLLGRQKMLCVLQVIASVSLAIT